MKDMAGLLLYGSTRQVELGASVYTLVYGLAFVVGQAHFGVSQAFDLIELLIGEQGYGLIVTALGLPSFVGLVQDNLVLRRIGAACNLVCWAAVFVMVAIGSLGQSGGLGHFLLAAIANFYLLVRLRDAR